MGGWPARFDLLLLQEVDSTNAEAARRARSDPPSRPLWIGARRQTAGRGRLGRRWESPEGNLAATLLTEHPGGPREAARLYGFAAPLAAADTVAALAPTAQVRLKWPNDVLLDGRKVAGVLIETVGTTTAGGLWLAVGVGINLVAHPELPAGAVPATSLRAATGDAPAPEEVLVRLARSLESWLLSAAGPEGYKPLLEAWRGRLAGIGGPIEARLADGESVVGLFEGVDDGGHLLLRTGAGLRRIAAADVHLRE